MSAGIDPRTQLIPIAPAVHYHMGGLETDEFGRTSIPGLYAIGECAATGVHGANRLASNSLLEAIVFGGRAADHINSINVKNRQAETIKSQPWLSMGKQVSQVLRINMTQYCGVRRTASGLNTMLGICDDLIGQVGRANPLIAAKMIVAGALAREESRGGHTRIDFPNEDNPPKSSYMTFDMLE